MYLQPSESPLFEYSLTVYFPKLKTYLENKSEVPWCSRRESSYLAMRTQPGTGCEGDGGDGGGWGETGGGCVEARAPVAEASRESREGCQNKLLFRTIPPHGREMRKLGMEQRTEAAEDVIRLSVRRTVGTAVNAPPQPIQKDIHVHPNITI